jgi:hypothetical protein
MSYINISHIGNKHNEWLSGLDFYKDDIHLMEQRLSELVGRNLDLTARQNMEHFQNQFIVQKNNIDELKHKINEHLKHLGKDAGLHAGHINQVLVEEHGSLEDEYKILERLMNDLRHEFNNYLSLHSAISSS